MPSERDKARWRWQFSIRELLIATLAIASALGWWFDRARLRREVERQRIQLQLLADSQLLWEVKYKSFRTTVDDILQLEHFGRPLVTYSPDELAALKKEIDKQWLNASDTEPDAEQIKQRIEFFRKLHELQEGEPIPLGFGREPFFGRDMKTSQ